MKKSRKITVHDMREFVGYGLLCLLAMSGVGMSIIGLVNSTFKSKTITLTVVLTLMIILTAGWGWISLERVLSEEL